VISPEIVEVSPKIPPEILLVSSMSLLDSFCGILDSSALGDSASFLAVSLVIPLEIFGGILGDSVGDF